MKRHHALALSVSVAFFCLSLLLIAPGKSGSYRPVHPPLATPGFNQISITAAGFTPSELAVDAGEMVSWVNDSGRTHVLVSGVPFRLYMPILRRPGGGFLAVPMPRPGLSDGFGHYPPNDGSPLFEVTLAPGESFQYTFDLPGDFPFYLGTAPQHVGRVTVTGTVLPPDPVAVAPAVDQTVATTLDAAVAFLYQGENPIQSGVAPGTIDPVRLAVLRGRVTGRDGAPLSGVNISILHRPELGQSVSRQDGAFDMVVNGGGRLVVDYRKEGFIPAQRHVDAPWQAYVQLPDVVLIPRDETVTTVPMENAEMAVARGSVVVDGDGQRQATVLFPPGTEAEIVLEDGTTQPVSSLSVRLTEFTVGENGPQTMPADLPPLSGYTYAVELSADEVQAAVNGREVLFNQPIFVYLENFLDFPAGAAVPVGYYDNDGARWVPSENGRVLAILSISQGLAQLDTTGDGAADNGVALGVTNAERQRLAALYAVGQSVWRVPVTHFSAHDFNWPYGPATDATTPEIGRELIDFLQNPLCTIGLCAYSGSVIGAQNQTLGEALPVVGTPFSLHYRSERTPGFRGAYTLDVPVSNGDLPGSLEEIRVEIGVAGRVFTATLEPLPDQFYRFEWDGRDAYGRLLQGAQPVYVQIGYVYDAFYQEPADLIETFGYSGNGVPLSYDPARQEFVFYQWWETLLGTWDARGNGVGGWSLDVHHVYDPVGKTLYLGNGGMRRETVLSHVIDTVAGGGDDQECELCTAGELQMDRPHGVAPAPDGSLYIADTFSNQIRILRADGNAETVTALDGVLKFPFDVAVAPDGALFVADTGTQVEPGHNRILRVEADGTYTVVAGTGSYGYNGDGIPATAARLYTPAGVALGPDGSIYIADTGNHRIRRVSASGIIQTVAGTGVAGFSGDGGQATEARLDAPWGIAVGEDGVLYVADHNNRRIRRVGVDGTISTVGPDFGLRTTDVALGSDGSLYVSLGGAGNQVQRVAPDGSVTPVAGDSTAGFGGDGGPATEAQLAAWVYGVASGQRNNLYVADNNRVREVTLPLPGFENVALAVPSADGRLLFEFDASGRHQRTLNGVTGATVYTFTYGVAGRLTTITDGDGNVTTIQRTAGITPTAIVAPFGQTTDLNVGGQGWLSSVTDPLGRNYLFEYSSRGLLERMTDPRQNDHQFGYAPDGRLIRDSDPAGGYRDLVRLRGGAAYTVTVSSAQQLSATYRVGFLDSGEQLRVNVLPDGTRQEMTLHTDAGMTVLYADGTEVARQVAGDPRFLMEAPYVAEQTLSTPGGLLYRRDETRQVLLPDGGEPLAPAAMTDTVSVNGRIYRQVYDAAAQTWTHHTPEERLTVTAVDDLGRPIRIEIEDVEPRTFEYDPYGRLAQVVQGERQSLYAYDAGSGFLTGMTNALGESTTLVNDAAGRPRDMTLPGGATWSFQWDGNDNLERLTEPGGTVQHEFLYDAADRLIRYESPLDHQTGFAYDLDGRVVTRTLPSGAELEWLYNHRGQVAGFRTPQGEHAFDYDGTTGRLITAASRDGQIVTYDYDGLLLTGALWSGAVDGAVGYQYDDNLRVTGLAIAGTTLPVSYDDDNLLTGVGGVELTYRNNGLLSGIQEGDFGLSLSYNDYAEIGAITAAHAGILYDAQLARDALGRVTQKVETIGGVTTTWTYGYTFGQLVTVRRDGVLVESYDYDPAGNRTEMYNGLTGVTLPISYAYDAEHKLLSAGGIQYTYDADGRLRTVGGGGGTTCTYNADGTLAAVEQGGETITYRYDAQGRRIAREVDGVRTHAWLYGAGLAPLAEYDGTGVLRSIFIYAGQTTPVKMIRNGAVYHIVSDLRGSPRLVADGAGNVVRRIDYDSFGNVIQDTNPAFDLPFGFAGGLSDPGHELIRFGVRDYQPSTGRWAAPDPVLFGGGLHLYRYGGGDPVNWVDRTGAKGRVMNSTSTADINVEAIGVKGCRPAPLEMGLKPLAEVSDPTAATGSAAYASPPTGLLELALRKGDQSSDAAETYGVAGFAPRPPAVLELAMGRGDEEVVPAPRSSIDAVIPGRINGSRLQRPTPRRPAEPYPWFPNAPDDAGSHGYQRLSNSV